MPAVKGGLKYFLIEAEIMDDAHSPDMPGQSKNMGRTKRLKFWGVKGVEVYQQNQAINSRDVRKAGHFKERENEIPGFSQ